MSVVGIVPVLANSILNIVSKIPAVITSTRNTAPSTKSVQSMYAPRQISVSSVFKLKHKSAAMDANATAFMVQETAKVQATALTLAALESAEATEYAAFDAAKSVRRTAAETNAKTTSDSMMQISADMRIQQHALKALELKLGEQKKKDNADEHTAQALYQTSVELNKTKQEQARTDQAVAAEELYAAYTAFACRDCRAGATLALVLLRM